MEKGFTLIELIVSIAIIAVLSGIILFSVTQYINTGKDSNISANLAILITAGEVYYNGSGNNSYVDFCATSVVVNAKSQMPKNPSGYCYDSSTNVSGACCYEKNTGDMWAACARELSTPSSVYCVDSRGVKKTVENSDCSGIASNFQCP